MLAVFFKNTELYFLLTFWDIFIRIYLKVAYQLSIYTFTLKQFICIF